MSKIWVILKFEFYKTEHFETRSVAVRWVLPVQAQGRF
jgi:hypothetical protein